MENKINQTIKNLFKTKKQKIIALVSGLLVLTVIIGIIVLATVNQSPKVTEESLIPTLKLVGELTTTELNFSGYKEYKDSGIVFFTRSDFLMTYEATLRAGIDMTQVEIDVNDLTKTVTVTVPNAEIQEVKVKPDTIKYYDKKFALFNFDSKEDANAAQKIAEDEAKIEAEKTGILNHANDHAKTLIENLLQNAIPEEYSIIIK